MLGGKDDPCVNDHMLRTIQEEEGRVCPRVELDEDVELAGRLALFAARAGSDNPLFRLAWDVETEQLPYEERHELLYVLLTALADEGVVMRLKRDFDERIAKMKAERS